MLEKAIIRRGENSKEFDVGTFSESLLFYGKVHLLLDNEAAYNVLSKVGINNLEYLKKEGMLSLSYTDVLHGCVTIGEGFLKKYELIEVHKYSNNKKIDPERNLIRYLVSRGYAEYNARLDVRKLFKIAEVEKIKKPVKGSDSSRFISSVFSDPAFIQEASILSVARRLPNFIVPRRWEFKIHHFDDGMVVDTNFDFATLNKSYTQIAPQDTFSASHVLADVLQASVDVHQAARHSAELITDEIGSRLLQSRFEGIANKIPLEIDQMVQFQRIILDGRSIRESINQGSRTFDDFLILLNNARKFKTWVNEVGSEHQLIGEYIKEIDQEPFMQSLPMKILRFGLSIVVGPFAEAAIAAGDSVLSATDTFLVDKLSKGWKPNQFVKKHLNPFVGDS